MKKIFCVISHTHWDREWYMPFELFRLKLVDLIDRLLKLIEEKPDYIFHLDAQTVVLEDYLEIRPEKRAVLEKYITSGNIIVGPWYLQNDFYLTSGEATIRNLIRGTKIAESFGNCANVGYAPDQFGNISQLPQILNNFKIDNFVFARGFDEFYEDSEGRKVRKKAPLEFLWEGADGTQLLAVHMRGFYNNAQRIPIDVEKAKLLTDIIERDFEGMISTENYLLMNGVDHLEPQRNVLEAIENYNKGNSDGRTMKQYKMSEYISEVKKSLALSGKKLSIHKGELRKGDILSILPGTLSSRHYLKVANVKAQNMLEQRLEPLYSMLELIGCKGAYSYDHFAFAWKKLLQNHPHDSICGCSRDEVHAHMEDNYKRIEEFCNELLRRGSEEIFYHSFLAKSGSENKYAVSIMNTTGYEMSQTITVVMDFLVSDEISNFILEDMQGNEIPYTIISKETKMRDVFSPLNLPGVLDIERNTILVSVSGIKPYSVYNIFVKPGKKVSRICNKLTQPVLENENIRLEVHSDGKIDFYDKKRNKHYHDVLYLEESGDRGDAYNYCDTGESVITSKEFAPEICVDGNNEFSGKITVKWDMIVPEYYDFDELRRSDTSNHLICELQLELKKYDEFVTVNYTAENHCKDHRLRIILTPGFDNPLFFGDMPFDIVKREHCFFDVNPTNQTFPNTSFVAVQENNCGIEILTEGAHEAEIIKPEKIAVTLLRSTGVITRTGDHKHGGGDQWDVPENQCLRTINGRLAFCGYEGSLINDDVMRKVSAFRTPLLANCYPIDRRKFSGGRMAVQDTKLEELFYLPDAYPDACIPDNTPCIEVNGKQLFVSALKLSEDREGIIVRVYNYGKSDTDAEIKTDKKIYLSDMSEENKTLLGEKIVNYNISPKKVITFYISL